MGLKSKPKGIEETEAQRALADVSAEQFEMFDQQFSGIQAQFMDDMKSANEESNYQAVTGMAVADAGKALDERVAGTRKTLAAANINPTSGLFGETMTSAQNDADEIMTDTTARAQSDVQNNYVKGISNVIAMGEKTAMEGYEGTLDMAGRSMNYANQSAQRKAQNRANNRQTLGFAIGTGYSLSKLNDEEGGE